MLKPVFCALLIFVCVFAFGQAGSVIKINGSGLFVETMGTGEPLLVVHGGPGLNHSYFRPHLDQLAKKYKLIYYDQRASGLSVIPSSDSVSLKFFAEDIEALRTYFAIDKINILAHSWGAIPAIDYATLFPAKVKKLILVNPVPLSHAYDHEIAELQQGAATARDTTDRAIIRGSRDFKNGVPDAYRRLMLLSFRHVFYDPSNLDRLELDVPDNFIDASRALGAGLKDDLDHYDFYEAVKTFTFPVLILAGKSDLTPVEATSRIKANISSSQMIVYQKSGHFVFVEETKKFTKDVTDFLSR